MSTLQARRKAIVLCSTLLLWAGAASALDYPQRPIRVIVPYPPGGGTDAVMRSVAPRLAEILGRPIVVDNKPGGSSSIGLDAVAKARPDGYTLGFVNMAFVANPSLMKLPFDTEKDFVPVGMISTLPLVVAVHPSVPARSLKEFIALAKSQPGKLFYASAGNGTSNHLLPERFKLMTGINVTHVPYKGGAPPCSG
jgi:tripartite-type tricarboxylate transporter receptor subunit TctC